MGDSPILRMNSVGARWQLWRTDCSAVSSCFFAFIACGVLLCFNSIARVNAA